MTYERRYNLLNSKFKELFFPTLLAAIAGNFAILADAFIISAFLGPMNLSVIQSIEPLAQFTNIGLLAYRIWRYNTFHKCKSKF
ncbi:MAG: hypothetical protein IJI42_00575 [Methanobrevibacter sp.]|nr:hypothetical protein [Methanobrevibacter sp.]